MQVEVDIIYHLSNFQVFCSIVAGDIAKNVIFSPNFNKSFRIMRIPKKFIFPSKNYFQVMPDGLLKSNQ